MTGFKLNSSKGAPDEKASAGETFEMLFDYVKRETIKPIRGAGRWISFGLVAASSLSIGLVLGALGILRLIQTSSLGDSADWSWISYVVALIVCAFVFWFAISRIRKGTLEKS